MVTPKLKYESFSICLLLVIGVLAVSGCSKPKSSYDYLVQARQDHSKGDDHAALIDLKNALKKDAKNGEARLLLAQILNEQGEGSAAEIELHKAMDLGVNKSYVAVAMGQALILQQEYKKVIDTIAVGDDDKGKVAADIYNVRGEAYLGLRKADEAKSAFEKALKEYPDSADAYLGMARLAAIQNDLNGALQQVAVALSKDPKSIKGWIMKARLLRAQTQDEEAITAYNHILQIDEGNVPAHLGLAAIDMVQNKRDAAKAKIDAVLKNAPKDLEARYMLALVEFQLGKFKEAQDAIQIVLKGAPDYQPGILLHGAIAFAQGSYEQARDDISGVLSQYPNNAYARRLLAATQLKLGETDHMLATLQPLLNPEHPDVQALALAGEAQMKAKNYAAATDYLQKAIELQPNAPQIQTQLALSNIGAGKAEQGINELEEVSKQSPGRPLADMLLAVTHLRRQEYKQALDAISNLEQKLGPNPVTDNLKGVVLLDTQDYPNARKSFEKALALQPSYYPAAINLAKLDLRDNNPDAARKHLEAVLEKDKNNLQTLMALAGVAASQKQEQEYLKWLERAREAQPNAILPRVKLAEYYLSVKDSAKALNIANEAVKAYPNSFDAMVLLGTTQMAAGDNETALKTFAKLVARAPSAPASYLKLAQAQIVTKRLNDARLSLDKALKLKPEYQQAQDLLIRIDLAENKWGEALKVARQMQVQQPSSSVGYDREADILMAQKQYVKAVKPYEQALTKGAGSAGLIKLHRALTLAGDTKAAEQRLTSWLQQHPEDVTVRAYAADYYMVSSRSREAIAQYEELLKLAPQNAMALNNLATLYQRVGDDRALSIAERALKLEPEDPGVQDTVGWLLVDKGQLPRALDLLHSAANKLPQSGLIHYHLAVALAHSGQKVEAKKELETAIGTGQKFSELNDAKEMLKGL